MMPKNGFRSISRPHGRVATPRLESIGNVGQAIERKILGQGAGQRPLGIPAPVGAELDVEHLDRQRIAALGAFDMDRAGQDVAAQMRLQLAQDLAMLGQHVERLAGQDLGRPTRNGWWRCRPT
jgi:hypothetical protein